ncbi:MAG: hydrogenase formation protein HypD [Candidatus Cyclonatronum sp.]|uniref:hydrogenase formation protein HypD n=1 Tax=Cyclonatronum sp. TaxID=3024185 RepID=UPI0025BE9413|nr:hydrogenase formation protein HypD [Cyclonatronum sp.]MCH8485313.1 hydrogenase formation protein HypD [Cyclonatronum sp.]
MKHLTEYRDARLVKQLLERLRKTVSKKWHIMEVCGGQTHGLVRHGILDMLPPEISMIHGPGCPVCVTPVSHIDTAVSLALDHNVILCSFGDMLRVPGSSGSLLQARAQGADVRVVYAPYEAVQLAQQQPDREVVFFAVGFETTAPANALSVLQAHQLGLKNYSLLTAHVLVPPAMTAIMSDPETRVNAFLAAGHVCAVSGMQVYEPFVKRWQVPVVVTGFEPVDLLQGICSAAELLESSRAELVNQYRRAVHPEGNPFAIKTADAVFEKSSREWRGIGEIPESGLRLRSVWSAFDAFQKFGINPELPAASTAAQQQQCRSGEVMKGLIKPAQCQYFGTGCTPETPLGAPMVSSEGACAAYYQYVGGWHHES